MLEELKKQLKTEDEEFNPLEYSGHAMKLLMYGRYLQSFEHDENFRIDRVLSFDQYVNSKALQLDFSEFTQSLVKTMTEVLEELNNETVE